MPNGQRLLTPVGTTLAGLLLLLLLLLQLLGSTAWTAQPAWWKHVGICQPKCTCLPAETVARWCGRSSWGSCDCDSVPPYDVAIISALAAFSVRFPRIQAALKPAEQVAVSSSSR